MNSGWITMIGCAAGAFFAIAVAGRYDKLTVFFGIMTGVAYGFCFIDGSYVWLIPATALLVVTVMVGRSKRRAESPSHPDR